MPYFNTASGGGTKKDEFGLKVRSVQSKSSGSSWSFSCNIGDFVMIKGGTYGSETIKSGFQEMAVAERCHFGIATDTTITGTLNTTNGNTVRFVIFDTPKNAQPLSVRYCNTLNIPAASCPEGSYIIFTSFWGDNNLHLRAISSSKMFQDIIVYDSAIVEGKPLAFAKVMSNNAQVTFDFAKYGDNYTGQAFNVVF